MSTYKAVKEINTLVSGGIVVSDPDALTELQSIDTRLSGTLSVNDTQLASTLDVSDAAALTELESIDTRLSGTLSVNDTQLASTLDVSDALALAAQQATTVALQNLNPVATRNGQGDQTSWVLEGQSSSVPAVLAAVSTLSTAAWYLPRYNESDKQLYAGFTNQNDYDGGIARELTAVMMKNDGTVSDETFSTGPFMSGPWKEVAIPGTFAKCLGVQVAVASGSVHRNFGDIYIYKDSAAAIPPQEDIYAGMVAEASRSFGHVYSNPGGTNAFLSRLNGHASEEMEIQIRTWGNGDPIVPFSAVQHTPWLSVVVNGSFDIDLSHTQRFYAQCTFQLLARSTGTLGALYVSLTGHHVPE